MTATNPTALIVDDEPDICELIKLTLARMDVDCDTATSLPAAKALLNDRPYHLCITDLRLKNESGLDLIDHINSNHPETPVAMITANLRKSPGKTKAMQQAETEGHQPGHP